MQSTQDTHKHYMQAVKDLAQAKNADEFKTLQSNFLTDYAVGAPALEATFGPEKQSYGRINKELQIPYARNAVEAIVYIDNKTLQNQVNAIQYTVGLIGFLPKVMTEGINFLFEQEKPNLFSRIKTIFGGNDKFKDLPKIESTITKYIDAIRDDIKTPSTQEEYAEYFIQNPQLAFKIASSIYDMKNNIGKDAQQLIEEYITFKQSLPLAVEGVDQEGVKQNIPSKGSFVQNEESKSNSQKDNIQERQER